MAKNKIDFRSIIKLFKKSDKPLTRNELYKTLAFRKQDKKKIRAILNELVNQGKLIQTGRAYCLVNKLPVIKGKFEMQKSGIAFVLPEDKRRKDVYIHPNNFEGAWHGDTVLVALLPQKKGKSPEGRVVRILERQFQELTVKVTEQIGPNIYLTRPTDLKLQLSLIVEITKPDLRLNPGDIIVVRPDKQLEARLWSGIFTEKLGPELDLKVQEELVKKNHLIPSKFDSSVINEIEALPSSPVHDDFNGRQDLTQLDFVTIDGAKAKDFDDAIFVEKKGGQFRLFVAIADVAHYVQLGSSLDREAQERGNSYYFPLSVEPMFPEKLSNGLCSLKPRVPRLVMVAEMTFSAKGLRKKARFYPAVIKSKYRLTYSQVHEAVELGNKKVQKEITSVLPMLNEASKLARLLLQNRKERGSIDFDLPEPEVLFNIRDGQLQVRPRVRNFAHQIIEEFMIAANEAVASFLEEKGILFLYRIHPQPDEDKLDSLFKLLASTQLGQKLPKEKDPKSLQILLKEAKDTDLEFLVNRLLLRSMMQAKYSPFNEGHFGLASTSYCHFTSPIRRYADLTVHRALKKVLNSQIPAKQKPKKLKKLGESLSILERKAMEAEREILKRATILSLMTRVGESFTGVISSLTDFGFWVELEDVLADGLVRLSSLADDYYTFWPDQQKIVGRRTGKTFSLGQKVEVILQKASLDRLELDLSILD
ncbi:ribonuclease R [Desulfohalobiaceae bacterium Ax17]|uniref:ribonuclease R n=1 Tax=Desulfovulcanus ferrireducens TaxID=2831190 RepID=UPI00207BBC6D|nr:ribonuclease R [Desulfovulcanus ferrireducens]MBT8763705.1 ribonuclease R [Desulfovulcanus ferrireducens]